MCKSNEFDQDKKKISKTLTVSKKKKKEYWSIKNCIVFYMIHNNLLDANIAHK